MMLREKKVEMIGDWRIGMLHLGLAGYIQLSDTRGLGPQLDRLSYLQWSHWEMLGSAGAREQSLQHVYLLALYSSSAKTNNGLQNE